MKIYKCDICNKEFDSIYKVAGHKGSHSRKKGMKKNKKFMIINCLNCNKEIKILESIYNNDDIKNPKFCSHDCHYKYKNKLKNESFIKIFGNNELQTINITYNQYKLLKNTIKKM